ncbi:uncharacterized protein [Hoplias malabaricus]|uniref:uncharacterized protein n=1 Tax=Hoplias malabaricus TaxID=27720 RepID=UPI003462BDD6
MEVIEINHYCKVKETQYKRLSKRTIEYLTHNIGISGVMESDSGQYLCALRMDTSKTKKTNVKWKVIERVTVSVSKNKSPTTTRTEETPEETHEEKHEERTEERTEERNGSDPLMPLYTSWPIGLALLFSVWVTFAFLRIKAKSSQGSQSVELQSHQQEATPDADESLDDASQVIQQIMTSLVAAKKMNLLERKSSSVPRFAC